MDEISARRQLAQDREMAELWDQVDELRERVERYEAELGIGVGRPILQVVPPGI
jgi:polyhydroxyalkanoate synthesis regulator phasin